MRVCSQRFELKHSRRKGSCTRDFTTERQSPLYWPKSLYFIMIGLDPRIMKRVNYFSCMGGKGGMTDI